ncbi:hypothetical protein F441_16720 [Phytophthora nicotianae CJ01A1]|uniref:DNA mismatch repair proteins mutS family domain-containing protein n=4 Tax=Phytophthora nicotianae TaxID=4792 RepID=V9G2D6_PHYNI|nr:hypothetical protein F443_00107 [Phytophthora nicotianae P1569]ETK77323.1 hypothetical protein L915_16414 [Phytophthora nicotianae]ETO65847.1 hypothetical protein F444_16900 [Phytophthora nicotianae P1976]ETO99629.1 hypothetical protein F441_22955 [Phytophthora nicotianae CJ01A1]ETK90639.1 hypothetical protein L915_05633 [Phytophthora nicotianae]
MSTALDIHVDYAIAAHSFKSSCESERELKVEEERAKLAVVEEGLDLLDIANQIIRALMMRLAMGVELAAQPSVMFLDEPACGKDANSAYTMKCLP